MSLAGLLLFTNQSTTPRARPEDAGHAAWLVSYWIRIIITRNKPCLETWVQKKTKNRQKTNTIMCSKSVFCAIFSIDQSINPSIIQLIASYPSNRPPPSPRIAANSSQRTSASRRFRQWYGRASGCNSSRNRPGPPGRSTWTRAVPNFPVNMSTFSSWFFIKILANY